MKLFNLQKKQIEKLINIIGSDYDYEIVPLLKTTNSKPLQCFSNVENKVALCGGAIYYGWSVHFGSYIIEAERHAVWQDEDENLFCITPHPSNKTEVIFIPDNRKVEFSDQIDNVRLNNSGLKIVDDWINICENINLLYNRFTKRVDDEQVIVPTEVGKVINIMENYRSLLYNLIKQKESDKVKCFCEKGINDKRKYFDCHSKKIKEDFKTYLDELENLAKI